MRIVKCHKCYYELTYKEFKLHTTDKCQDNQILYWKKLYFEEKKKNEEKKEEQQQRNQIKYTDSPLMIKDYSFDDNKPYLSERTYSLSKKHRGLSQSNSFKDFCQFNNYLKTNVNNSLNVKLDFENKVFNKEKYLIKKLKPLKFNIYSKCDNILQANNDEISISILNLKEKIKNSDNKNNLSLFYIPLFGLKTSIKIKFKDNINNIKDVKKLLFQSNNDFHIESNNLLFYNVCDRQFEGVITENSRIKDYMFIFIYQINQMI